MKKKLYIWIQIILAATLLGVVVGNYVENLPKKEKKAKKTSKASKQRTNLKNVETNL